jgi:hypothetical protein
VFIRKLLLHTSGRFVLNYFGHETHDSKKMRRADGLGNFTLSLRRLTQQFGFVKQQLCSASQQQCSAATCPGQPCDPFAERGAAHGTNYTFSGSASGAPASNGERQRCNATKTRG